MSDLGFLKLLNLDVWLEKDSLDIKFCSILSENKTGLLAVDPRDINPETRELLKKILAAFKFRASQRFNLSHQYDFLIIFGGSIATLASKKSVASKVFNFPGLLDINADTSIKKQIWSEINQYIK